MILSSFLKKVRDDLLARLEGGDILLNNTVSVPVNAVAISSYPTVNIQDGIAIKVYAPHIRNVSLLSNVKLRTKTGDVVAEKSGSVEIDGKQFISVTFAIELKGGV